MSNLNPNCLLCLDPCAPQDNFDEFKKHLITFANDIQLFTNHEETNDDVPRLIFCETCHDHLERFSDLLTALQIAEMKVDSCLKDIQDLMQKKGNTGTEEVGTFRKNLIEKTSSKLGRSRSQPIIKIEKTRISRITTIAAPEIETPSEPEVKVEPSVKVEPEEEETLDFADLGMEYNDDDDNSIDIDIENNVKMDVERDSQSSEEHDEEEDHSQFLVEQKFKDKRGRRFNRFYCLHCKVHVRYGERHLQVVHKKTSTNDTPEQLDCPYCRARFTETRIVGIKRRRVTSTMGAWLLRQHIFQYHSEHYFPTHRKDTVSSSDFQKIIVELLFQDLIEGKESCAYCPRPFNIPSGRKQKIAHFLRIKMHYVESHFEMLEGKLKEIQEDPDLPEKLRSCNSEGILCNLCGIYLTNMVSLIGHRKLHCKFTEGRNGLSLPIPLEKLPVSVTDVEGKVKCNICGSIVTQEWAKNHVKNHSKVGKRKKMRKKEEVSESKSDQCDG